VERLLEETANQTGKGDGSIQGGKAGKLSVRTPRAVHRQRPAGGVGGFEGSQQRCGGTLLLMRFIIIFIFMLLLLSSLLAECKVHNRTWNLERYSRAKAV